MFQWAGRTDEAGTRSLMLIADRRSNSRGLVNADELATVERASVTSQWDEELERRYSAQRQVVYNEGKMGKGKREKGKGKREVGDGVLMRSGEGGTSEL